MANPTLAVPHFPHNATSGRAPFWLTLILLGVFTLGVFFGPSTAAPGAVLYAGLLASGIVFVRIVLRGRA